MGAIDSFVPTSAAERHRQRIYLSGIQALVRLPLLQRQLDRHQDGFRNSPSLHMVNLSDAGV
jgi:hypothetical protein